MPKRIKKKYVGVAIVKNNWINNALSAGFTRKQAEFMYEYCTN